MEEQRLTFDEAREAGGRQQRLHHAHAGAGRQRRLRALTDRPVLRRATGRSLGLDREDFLALGRQNAGDEDEPFCMTVLALRLAQLRATASASCTARLARQMWQQLWPGVPVDEVPIQPSPTASTPAPGSRTTWPSCSTATWARTGTNDPPSPASGSASTRSPTTELWRTHERRRERLVAFARQRLREQLAARGATAPEIERRRRGAGPRGPDHRLCPPVRHLQARQRCSSATWSGWPSCSTTRDRPVQIIFAGKAHPQDNAGKELIRQIVHSPERRSSAAASSSWKTTT